MTCPSRAERLTLPLARSAIRDLTLAVGGCIRPIQMRRTDDRTGETDYQMIPCGATVETFCPPCADRARSLRAEQCRDGWHLEDEPDLTPGPPDETQEFWLNLRAEAQVRRDKAHGAGEDTAELDELIGEVDDELAVVGVRGSISRNTRSGYDDDPVDHRGGRGRPGAARTHPTSPAVP